MSDSAALAEVMRTAAQWRDEGKRVVLARVVAVAGSAPRPPGTTMAMADTGEVAGSLTGGCVEAAVVTAAELVLVDHRSRVMPFGYGDEAALEVGLSCGGRVDVWLTGDTLCDDALAALHAGEAFAMATLVGEPTGRSLFVTPDGATSGTLGEAGLDQAAADDAAALLASGDPWRSGLRHYPSADNDASVFVEAHLPRPVLVVIGAVDVIASTLVRLASALGFTTIVSDPRSAFATEARFPDADEVVVDRPERLLERIGPRLGPRDAVCVLTHRLPFDVPAVQAALCTQVGYLGALGSRSTTAQREDQLRAQGVTAEELRRVHAPIGLDLGATTPEEIALAVLAEVVANRNGASGGALRDGSGPLHRERGR